MPRADERFDHLVIGGGIIGLASAWRLAGRGLRVALLEQDSPGHAGGSSHGDGRIFRYTYPDPEYVELARAALHGWRELADAAGVQLLQGTGNLDVGPVGSPEIVDLATCLASQDVAYDILAADECERRFPQVRPPAGSILLHQADCGVLHADRALAALGREAARRGVEVRAGVAAHRIECGSSGVRVTAAGGERFSAKSAIVAAGSWVRDLLEPTGLALPLEVRCERYAYFRQRPAPPAGIDHRAGSMPTLIDYHTTEPYYALPQISVPGVKVGHHHAGRRLASPTDERPSDPEEVAGLARFVERHLPYLDPEPFGVSTCLYTNTADLHFLVDRHPAEPAIAIGAGFSGHGFKFAPAIGEELARLALNEEPSRSIGLFRLDRLL